MATPKNVTVLRLKHPVISFVTEANGDVVAFTSMNMYEARRMLSTRYAIDLGSIDVFDRTKKEQVLEMLSTVWRAGARKLGLRRLDQGSGDAPSVEN